MTDPDLPISSLLDAPSIRPEPQHSNSIGLFRAKISSWKKITDPVYPLDACVTRRNRVKKNALGSCPFQFLLDNRLDRVGT